MIEILIPLSLFAFVTSITPGPNNIMLLASGVNFGFRATIPHIIGISAGFFSLLFAVGIGLGEMFKIYPLLYVVLKVISVIYFLYLAWRIVNSAAPQRRGAQTKGRPLNFFEAAFFQWINPKAIIMAIACFSVYAMPDAGLFVIFLMSLIFTAINAPCVGMWALFGSKLRDYLQNPTYLVAFNWTIAMLLLASLLPILFNHTAV